jgi:hypothetical protein
LWCSERNWTAMLKDKVGKRIIAEYNPLETADYK